MKILAILLAGFVLSSCTNTVPTIPEDYTGPRAVIIDSQHMHDTGKSDFFYLSHIDGNKIEDSRSESLSASYGNGNNLTTAVLSNPVPAKTLTLTIVGRTVYAMPIRALTGTVHEVKGDIEFTPAEGANYIIKGTLAEDKSSVWIEDTAKPNEVIESIVVDGPSKLGIFQK